MSLEAWSVSLLTVLVASLHIWAEQTIPMPTETQIVVSDSVNPILSRPQVQFCSRQSRVWHVCSLLIVQFACASGASYSLCEPTQTCASDAESVTVVLIRTA